MPQMPYQHTIGIPKARSAIMRCSEQKAFGVECEVLNQSLVILDHGEL